MIAFELSQEENGILVVQGDKESLAKKSRNGSKTTMSQSQGSLQIEHFFQKANPS